MSEIRGESFEALVARPDTHVVLDLQDAGETLLVLFGGIAGGVSMPVFEFFRLTAGMPAKKAFFRDPRRGWYQLGLPRIGETADDVKRFLDATIERAQPRRVVMSGASAGGFAALLFGAWCNADEVLAFSPQTFLDAPTRATVGDARWIDQITPLHETAKTRHAVLDLLEVLPTSGGQCLYQVHVSTDDALDMAHARHIAGRSGVEIVEHLNGGHRLVKTLRDRGILGPLLLQALSPT